MRRRLLLAGIILVTASLAVAEELPLAAPEEVGMSAERLERVGGVLDELVDRREVPGFVTLVARKGKVVHWEAHGHRAIDSEDPMPRDAIFALASMTKPITVVSALMLFERGLFVMHGPISNYLPDFKGPMVRISKGETAPAKRELSPHDLFTHTSGVKDPLPRLEKYKYQTLAQHMSGLAREPLQFQPGTQWLYGDSHDVLGYFVEGVLSVRMRRLTWWRR